MACFGGSFRCFKRTSKLSDLEWRRVSASALQPILTVRKLHAIRSGAAGLPANGILKDRPCCHCSRPFWVCPRPDAIGRPPPRLDPSPRRGGEPPSPVISLLLYGVISLGRCARAAVPPMLCFIRRHSVIPIRLDSHPSCFRMFYQPFFT